MNVRLLDGLISLGLLLLCWVFLDAFSALMLTIFGLCIASMHRRISILEARLNGD